MGWLRLVGALKLGLFCKRALWKRRHSANETDNFKEPNNRSHPIPVKLEPQTLVLNMSCSCFKLVSQSCHTHDRVTSCIWTIALQWKEESIYMIASCPLYTSGLTFRRAGCVICMHIYTCTHIFYCLIKVPYTASSTASPPSTSKIARHT